VCFITFAREAAGASSTRLSVRPLSFRGWFAQKLGRITPREREAMLLDRHAPRWAGASEADSSLVRGRNDLTRGSKVHGQEAQFDQY
jgi:hypothetical protein